MNLIYAKPQQKRYSVERLRSLYCQLLRCIDINTDELCPRGMEDDIDTPNVNNTYWYTLMSSYVSLLKPNQNKECDKFCSNDQRKIQHNMKKKQDLDIAFRTIAAVNQADAILTGKDDEWDGDMVVVSDHTLRMAHKLESIAVQIIFDIGDVVINAERPSSHTTTLRSDDVFAYFCEKAILAMFVEIMIDRPSSTTKHSPHEQQSTGSDANTTGSTTSFNGVVWSPKVKAQILQTVTLLLSKVRDRSAIYYFLSQHCINQLIVQVLPLSQWTEAALQFILYPYIDLLKILSMQLSGSPDLFPLYTIVIQQPNTATNEVDTVVSFPLFSTIIHLTTSLYVQCDSYLYATCLNIVVGLLKISDVPIRTWITNCSEMEQQQLCYHLTQQSTEQYRRIVNIATGPIVDAERSKVIGIQLDTFNDQLDIYNDIFDCNIRTFNVRLCEILLQELIHYIIQYLLPGLNQRFFHVGISDRDVIPLREARVQVSMLLLSRLFSTIDYKPFLRMLAISLFHPQSTSLWESTNVKGYKLMMALNMIVQDKSNNETIPNLYRIEAMKLLSGEYGEWLVVGGAALFENALYAIEHETFDKIGFLPNLMTVENECKVSTLEESLTYYLDQRHEYKSIVSTMALDCITLLAVKYIIKTATYMSSPSCKEFHRFDLYYRTSTLVKAIVKSRLYFFDQTLQSLNQHQVNDIIISFIESVVQTRYKSMVSTPKRRATTKQQNLYVYALYPLGSTAYCKGSDSLIRKVSGAKWNDIEVSRFNITMALHFRAIHRILHRFHLEELQYHNPEQAAGPTASSVPISLEEFELIDEADELSSIFCCLQQRPSIGADLDLPGRMKFNFTVHGIQDDSEREERRTERIRTLSEDMIFRETSDLILILDATSIIVVRPIQHYDATVTHHLERGIIICYVPLLDVIAAACDGIRLHIAVRYENVGCLIRNGNMIVTLDSPGTCLIVHQYLEKCRKLLREDLYRKIVKLFAEDVPSIMNDCKSPLQQLKFDDFEIPQAKTF